MQQIEDDDMARKDRSEQPAPERRDAPKEVTKEVLKDQRSGNESPQSAPSPPLQNDGIELVRDSHC
jgi:hypothetical protein